MPSERHGPPLTRGQCLFLAGFVREAAGDAGSRGCNDVESHRYAVLSVEERTGLADRFVDFNGGEAVAFERIPDYAWLALVNGGAGPQVRKWCGGATMPSALKLDRDGKLAIPERGRAGVAGAVQDFLVSEGWTVIWTPAEDLKRSGAPTHERYTLDGLAVKAMQAPDWSSYARVVFFELKRRRARTDPKRLRGQTDTASELRKRGFLVYQAAENDPQPIGNFQRWYQESF